MQDGTTKCRTLTANSNAAPLNGDRWSREEIELLTELWRKDVPPEMISETTGRTERSVVVKASRLGLALRGCRKVRGAPKYPKKAQLRNCLRCEQQFFSQGVGNRICVKCKSDFSWRSGGDRGTAGH